MKTIKNMMIRNHHHELVIDISCGHSTIATSNYALIRSSGMLVGSLMNPHQMNEYFIWVYHLFDGSDII